MNKTKKFIILVVCTILILAIYEIVLKKNVTEATTEKIVKENVTEVASDSIKTSLTTSGEIITGETDKIALNTNYKLSMMCVEEGEAVKKDQKLIEYSNGTYELSPFDGIVTECNLSEINENCEATNYIELESTEKLNIQIDVLEEQLEYITSGKEVDIIVNYDESKEYIGTIKKINEIGTYSNGNTTFKAIVEFENDGNLKIGMSAVCTIVLEDLENIVTVPIEAITINNDNRTVIKVNDNGEKEECAVETGKSDANKVQIISGLSVGDKVYYETYEENKVETTEQKSLLSFDKNSDKKSSDSDMPSMPDGGPPSDIGNNKGKGDFND